MVFRIQANLKFASVGARNTAQATIASAVGGRNTIVRENAPRTTRGVPALVWEGTEAEIADPRVVYNAIRDMATPWTGRLSYHTCRHAEGEGFCVVTAETVR